MPAFEQESVDSCTVHEPLNVSQENYPWMTVEEATIPTFLVGLNDGTNFRFGSLIGLNKNVEKIAESVSHPDSLATQTVLFMGLPYVLRGQPVSGISKVENSDLPNSTLFIASRNLVSAAGLIFAVESNNAEQDHSTVLRAGISTAKQRQRLLGIMGIRQAGGKRRQF